MDRRFPHDLVSEGGSLRDALFSQHFSPASPRPQGSTTTTSTENSNEDAQERDVSSSSSRRVSCQQLLKSRGKGRARLPEKLMGYLNNDVAPGVIWWLPGGETFAFESSRVQSEFLDIYFRGTKLPSFIRSLNRWYVFSSSIN